MIFFDEDKFLRNSEQGGNHGASDKDKMDISGLFISDLLKFCFNDRDKSTGGEGGYSDLYCLPSGLAG